MKIRSIALLLLTLGITSIGAWADESAGAAVDSTTAANAPDGSAISQEQVAAPPDAGQAGAAENRAQSGIAEPSPAAPVASDVVRVPYLPEVVRREIKEEIRQEVLAQAKGEGWANPGTLPSWLSRISWSGNIRLRDQRDSFPAGNAPPDFYYPQVIDNTTDTHNYLRYQARLGMKAKVSDYTFAAFRLTTGTTSNPVSTNQSLGNGFSKNQVVFDQAYVQSTPYYWLALSGGKIPNPWLSTNLVWDTDVNFEGVAGQFRPRFSEEWNGYATFGAFPFQDIQRSDTVKANSKWLYAGQVGAKWSHWDSSTAQVGVALYQFRNVEGVQNSAQGSFLQNYSAAQSRQKGNSLMYVSAYGDPDIFGLASRFKEINYTVKLDWAAFDLVHVMAFGDYVKNLGFDAAEIEQRTGMPAPAKRVSGYHAGLTVGYPNVKLPGDWQASVAYKYVQGDAVLDALTDSDFHLGGTNAKGYTIEYKYGVDNGTSLGLRWISTDQIDGAPLAVDTLQVDLIVEF